MDDVLPVVAAGGALFNSWQIARLADPVDAAGSTMRTMATLLANRTRGSVIDCPSRRWLQGKGDSLQ